jgi:tetratricopeptide (TPR) repeat protein
MGAEVMNQNQRIPQNNSSIAWFKIANLIERREREKALSVYKLMAHSLQDKAYALQLEGDILCYFEDFPESCVKYLQSAFLYRNAKRWLDAVSLYEQVALIDPNNCDALIYSVPCYAQLDWAPKFKQNLETISGFILQNLSDEKLITNLIKSLAEVAPEIDVIIFKTQLHDKLQELLALVPQNLVEKLEPVIKKNF